MHRKFELELAKFKDETGARDHVLYGEFERNCVLSEVQGFLPQLIIIALKTKYEMYFCTVYSSIYLTTDILTFLLHIMYCIIRVKINVMSLWFKVTI